MSEDKAVLTERDGNIAVVRFNRPDSLNAFNSAQREATGEAIAEVNGNDDIRVVILTGAGRAFSAGADLGEVRQDGFDVETHLNTEYNPLLTGITQSPKPWISAVNGAAAGIGSAFAMNCDLTVMAEEAYLYQAFAAIGLIPDGGATWHLARTVGRKKAYELIALGEKLKAQKCLKLGLCNRVVPEGQLMDATLELARELATKAPLSLRHSKHTLNVAMTEPLDQLMSIEAACQALCVASEDSREGVLAFMEKRTPQFKGR